MKNYEVRLQCPIATSFRCQKAADSLDIDVAKKAEHHLKIRADLDGDFNVGLVVGASGSGKTTLAHQIWGEDVFRDVLKMDEPIIDQFPESMSYDECQSMLTGVGLTQVPCWIRPVYTLSNGQRARADIALRMASDDPFIVIDEWTSVVDRTVAKVMSHAIQKHARRVGKQVVLLSCHYDVIDWLMPDWVIDCNRQTFRRSLRRERRERLNFEIREVDKSTWKYFSRYHYLSDKLPGGFIKTFGLFNGADQIGFECFANYTPWKKSQRHRRMIMHSNRCVIHPDYVGLGIGLRFVNECSKIMWDEGYDVYAKLSAMPLVRARAKQPDLWELREVRRQIQKMVPGENMERKGGFRQKVKLYSYRWIGGGQSAADKPPPTP